MLCLLLTDSPTSQYRNKVIFNTIANHEVLYGVKAKWNFWEAGHGKGPCDGLGGTCTTWLMRLLRQGKLQFKTRLIYMPGTQSPHCDMRNVQFRFVSTETCQEKVSEIGKLILKPITGTMKIHAVAGKGNSIVAVRSTSCYCEI